ALQLRQIPGVNTLRCVLGQWAPDRFGYCVDIGDLGTVVYNSGYGQVIVKFPTEPVVKELANDQLLIESFRGWLPYGPKKSGVGLLSGGYGIVDVKGYRGIPDSEGYTWSIQNNQIYRNGVLLPDDSATTAIPCHVTFGDDAGWNTFVNPFDYTPKEKSAIIWAVAIGTILGTFPINYAYIKYGARALGMQLILRQLEFFVYGGLRYHKLAYSSAFSLVSHRSPPSLQIRCLDDPQLHPSVSEKELEKIQRDKTQAHIERDSFVPYKAILQNKVILVVWCNAFVEMVTVTLLLVYAPTYFHVVLGYDIPTTGKFVPSQTHDLALKLEVKANFAFMPFATDQPASFTLITRATHNEEKALRNAAKDILAYTLFP
ncbi:hypothetical protein TELCIR_11371, partial [Teladorsagia circumcincta]